MGLLDSRADDPIINVDMAQALGCEIRKTRVKAFDAGG